MKIERILFPPMYSSKRLNDQVQREIAAEIVGSVDPDADKNEQAFQFDKDSYSPNENPEKKEENETGEKLGKSQGLDIVV